MNPIRWLAGIAIFVCWGSMTPCAAAWWPFHHAEGSGTIRPYRVEAAPFQVMPVVPAPVYTSQVIEQVPPPVLLLKVQAPAAAALNTELEYCICVENCSTAAAHHVVVHDLIPDNAKFVRSIPEPTSKEKELKWDLGTMEGGSKKEIRLFLTPTAPGELDNCVRITFEHGVCVCTKVGDSTARSGTGTGARVTEAGQAVLKLQKRGPREAWVNETLTFELVATNSGSESLRNVVIRDILPDGLTHDSGKRGLAFEIGTLAPGESRTGEYTVVARRTGRLCNKATATAEGDFKQEAEWCVDVRESKLTISKTGPKSQSINAPIQYLIKVTNTGTTPINNVVVKDHLPPQATIIAVGAGGRTTGSDVEWSLGTLQPNASETVEVRVAGKALGIITNRVEATGDRGARATAEFQTELTGVPGMLFVVVDQADPVEIGEETQYTMIVRNQGSLPITNVRIIADVPNELGIVRIQEGTATFRQQGQRVTFDPITVQPATDAVYRIFVRATKVGDVRFRARLFADPLTAGELLQEESTGIYDGGNGRGRLNGQLQSRRKVRLVIAE